MDDQRYLDAMNDAIAATNEAEARFTATQRLLADIPRLPDWAKKDHRFLDCINVTELPPMPWRS